ncbi:protein kinase domain-containing protein [Streptomyces sp. CA-181903]|uniref:protein kinase domain-containing protein n=1 Tax=Streptomyces sp. CA-181903 TaxID=3240055 RepID=UPI003D8C954E
MPMAGGAGAGASGGSVRWRVGDVVDGRYEVLRVHEQGAMGLVYRVRHLRWGTDLAMKCPRPEATAAAADRERFLAEAETWASLRGHPNVCGCHFVRVLDGVPLVFAEYVPGGSLKEWMDDGRLYEGDEPAVLARILDVAIQAARGLGHAHVERIAHRDVKPANFLLDHDGTLKVTDFGMATAGATASFAGGMTQAYASPEQAGGTPMGWAVGRRGDVYSLAVSVLEMFTGGVTWLAGPVAGAALRAYVKEGRSGGDGLPRMPRAMAELLARCLRRNAQHRPESMTRLAAELADIHRESLGVDYRRPVPDPVELRADDHNNRGVSLLELGREKEAIREFAAALTADRRHPQATYNAGVLAWRRGALNGTLQDEPPCTSDMTLLAGIPEGSGDTWQARLMTAQVHLERGDTESAGALVDGLLRERPGEPEVLALADTLRSGRVPSGRCAGTREVPWHTGRRDPLGPPARLTLDGRWALTGDREGTTHLWDLRHGRRRLTLTHTTPEAVAVTSDGRIVVSAHGDGRLRCHGTDNGDCLYAACLPGWWPGSEAGLVRLEADDEGVMVAVAGEVQRWRVGEPEPWHRMKLRDESGGEADWRWATVSDDGRWALATRPAKARDRRSRWDSSAYAGRAVYVRNGTVQLWDLDSGGRRLTLEGPGEDITAAALSSEGAYALVGGSGLLRLWDLNSGRCVSRWRTGTSTGIGTMTGIVTGLGIGSHPDPRTGEILALSLSSDTRLALSGEEDGTVRLWDVHKGRCLRTFTGHRDSVAAVLMSAAGDTGISLAHDGTARWWEWDGLGSYTAPPHPSPPRRSGAAERAEPARQPPGRERLRRVPAAGPPPVPHEVFAGLRAARPVRRFGVGYRWSVHAVAIDPGGRKVFALGEGLWTKTTARIWDVARGWDERKALEAFSAFAISEGGTRVMAYGADGLVVWTADFAELVRVRGVRTDPLAVSAEPAAFSPDGRRALLVNAGRALLVYDLATGRRLAQLARGETPVTAVALSRDGRRAASADTGGRVRLWDLDGGGCLRLLDGRPGVPAALSLSADGGRVLSSGRHNDGMVLWDATTGARLRVFGDRSGGATVGRLTSDGRFAVSGGADGSVRVWDAGNGTCLCAFQGHSEEVRALALTPDGRYAASGSDDGTLWLWELDWERETGDGGSW